MTGLGAILLAGGRARRLDGASKPLVEIGGVTLLQRAVDAAAAVGASPITIVGPSVPVDGEVRWVQEDPPFGGPVAAVVAAFEVGVTAPDPEWTLLLACDLPRAVPAAARLVRDAHLVPRDTEGVCLAGASSRPQWLTGIYRTSALRRAAEAMPDAGRDARMRDLLDDLAIAVIEDRAGDADDVDTWEDVERARVRAHRESQEP